MIQEGEQGVPIPPQALQEALRVGVGPRGRQELVAPGVEERATRREGLLGKRLALGPQADGVAEEALELLAERRPSFRGVQGVDLFQFAQQVDEARLAGRRGDDVVGRPEVGDEDAGEFLGEELQERGRAPRQRSIM